MSKKNKKFNPEANKASSIPQIKIETTLDKDPTSIENKEDIEAQVQEITDALKNIDINTRVITEDKKKENLDITKIDAISKSEAVNHNKPKFKRSHIFILVIMTFLATMLFFGSMMISNKNAQSTSGKITSESISKITAESIIDLPLNKENVSSENHESDVIVEPELTPELQKRPMAQKTEVYKMLTDIAEGSKYATFYAPDMGIDVPLYYGDSPDILILNAIGQSTQTHQIGYAAAHILCSYEPTVMSGIISMNIGNKFSIETEYGVYVYSVVKTSVGHINPATGMIVDAAENNLINISDTTDTVYLYTDYNETQKYVVKAVLYGITG